MDSEERIIGSPDKSQTQTQYLDIDDTELPFVAPAQDAHTKAIFQKYNKGQIDEEDQILQSMDKQPQILFKIKNLDTGEEQFVSNQQDQQRIIRKISIGIQCRTFYNIEIDIGNKKNKWDSFWKNVQENNEKLKFYCQTGCYDEAKNIIDHGRNGYPVQINFKSLDEWTPLHFASYEGHDDIVQLLLQKNCNVNCTTKFHRNSLHISALRGHIEVVKKLCSYKIDVNAVDMDGNTALHFACQNGCHDIVQYLLSIYCAIKKNKDGQTPMDDCADQSIKVIFKKYGFREDGPYQEFRKEKFYKGNKLHMQIVHSKEKITPQDFTYYKMLGKGSFGEVFLVRKNNTGNKLYAMKVLNKDKVASKNLKRYAMTERNVLSAVDHPFMVKLYFAFQSSSKLFLVMDYYPGGDLGKLISKKKSLPESQAKKYVAEIVLALQALHKNMIVFRDLKPDNVVLDTQGHSRLTDFGLSKQGIYNNTTQSFCGSVAYLAPQILAKQGHSRTVDWYLLGLLLYELIVGLPPYYNAKKDILFENIKRGPLKIPKSMSNHAKDIIKKLLCRDPNRRLGAQRDSEQIKQHPFFEELNWGEVLQRKLEMAPIQQPRVNFTETIKVSFESGSEADKKIDGWTFVGQ